MNNNKKKVIVQETMDYQQKRLSIIKEINSYPVTIDRSCFKQNNKEGLKLAKKKLNEQILNIKDLAKLILDSEFDAGNIKLSILK